MTVFAALLRGVNVGGNNLIRMADLKALCATFGFTSATTLLQSGNVVFKAKGTDAAVARKLADGIEKVHGFRPAVMVRTADEIADAMTRNPWPAAAKSDPGHLLIAFMDKAPDATASDKLAALKTPAGEKLKLSGRELFFHFPNGIGKSKLTTAVLERAVGGIPMTARNWNTVGKLLDIARALES